MIGRVKSKGENIYDNVVNQKIEMINHAIEQERERKIILDKCLEMLDGYSDEKVSDDADIINKGPKYRDYESASGFFDSLMEAGMSVRTKD